MTASRALSNTQILRAALIVLVGFLASGILGFVRQGVLAAQFGAGDALDSFIAAQRIPEMIFVLVAGGALGSSFIPVFARSREADQEQAWQLASAVMTLSACAAALLGILVALAAPLLVSAILLPDASAAQQALTADLMRWMMITPFIFSISGLVMGILQSHGLFLLPSIAISMNNIGIMIGAIWIAPLLARHPFTAIDAISGAQVIPLFALQTMPLDQVRSVSVYGLAAGAVLSALLHLLVQIPGLLRVRARLRIQPDWRIEGVGEVMRLMAPRVLGLAVVQINFVVNIILTSGMPAGSLTVLNMAFTLMFFALGVIAQSVGSAVFPTLSALYAANDLDGFRDRLSSAMRAVLFLALPATAVCIVLAEPLVSIFERGEWTAIHTQGAAWALSCYAIGIAGFALLEVLSRAFYAIADTWTPVLIGIGAMLSNILLSLLLIGIIGEPDNLARGTFGGLALANALTTLIEAAVLWWLLRVRLRGIRDRFILDGSLRTLVASACMAAAMVIIAQISPVQGILLAMIGAIVGGVIFFAASLVLRIPEASVIPLALLRRFRR